MEATSPHATGQQGSSKPEEAENTAAVVDPTQKSVRNTMLADLTHLSVRDLLIRPIGPDSPIAESLRRIKENTDLDAIAGFSQGMT